MRSVKDCRHLDNFLALAGSSNSVGLWCPDCEDWCTKQLTSCSQSMLPKHHGLLKGVDVSTLKRVKAEWRECAICRKESDDTQLHHWCPKGLYKDLDLFLSGPADYLCPACHKEWHLRVTPNLI